MRRAWVAVAVLLCSSAAFSLDKDVKRVAMVLEQQYGVKLRKLPLIARVVMKPAMWGSGARADIMTFEGTTPEAVSPAAMEGAMKNALGPEWSWFIRSTSKKSDERAVIFVRAAGKDFEMMITSIEPQEAAVVKIRVKANEMKKWMDEPDEMALHRGKREQVASNEAAR